MSYAKTLFYEDLNEKVKNFQLRTFKPTSPRLYRRSRYIREKVIKSGSSFYRK